MPRGERIGDAYIRIHADGTGFDREIRQEFDPVIRSAGTNHGKTYAEAFNEELERRGPAKAWIKIARDINESIGRFDAGSQWIEGFTDRLDALREKVGKEFGPQIGDRLAQEIRDRMQKGLIQTQQDFDDFTEDLRPIITRLTQEIDEENQRILAKMVAAQKERLAEIEKAEADSSRAIITIKQREMAAIIANNAQRVKLEEENRKKILAGYKEIQESVTRLIEGHTKWGESVHTVRKRMEDLHKQMREVNLVSKEQEARFAQMRLSLIRLSPTLERTNRQWKDMSDNIGTLTGRGSRNNFLNFMGSVNRNLSLVFGTLIIGSARALTGITKLAFAWREFLDPAFAKEALKNTASFLANLANNAIALGIAFGIAAATSGILVAALSGLAAILTALVSTIGFALVGAVAALVGALAPIPFGIAVVIGAFKSLDEAQKEALKADVQPLVKAFKDLGNSAADVLFRDVAKWARQVAPLIRQMEPAVVGVARAIRTTLGEAIESASTSPAFESFIDRMNTFLPNATTKLGRIFTNVFAGIAGVFVAMLPLVNRFLGWLEDITGEFAAWANSKQGRQELKDFFEAAGDSAAALGEFLKQATILLGELLGAARKDGDQIFIDMANAIGRMVDYLRSPDGQKAMQDWLEFGRELASAIGDVLVAIFNLIDALDNPTTREFLTGILGGIADIVNFVAAHPNLMLFLLGPAAGVIGVLVEVGKKIKEVFFGEEQEPFLKEALADIPILAGESAASLDALRASLDQVTGAATETTRALAFQRIEAQGLIETGASLGLSARTLTSAALGNKGAMQQVTQAMHDQFLKTGTLSQEQLDLAADLGITAKELRQERRDIELTTAATQRYGGQLKSLPDKVKTLIRTEGIRPSVDGIRDVLKKAKELAPNLSRRDLKVIIGASGFDPTKKQLERIIKIFNNLDNEEAKPVVRPDVKPFDEGLLRVDRGLRTTGNKETKPRADLETKAFDARAQHVQEQITLLNSKKVEIPSALETSLLNQQVAALRALDFPPKYIDVYYRIHGNPGNPGGSDPSTTGNGSERALPSASPSLAPTINVYPQATDARAVAQETLNRVVAMSY